MAINNNKTIHSNWLKKGLLITVEYNTYVNNFYTKKKKLRKYIKVSH